MFNAEVHILYTFGLGRECLVKAENIREKKYNNDMILLSNHYTNSSSV